MYWYIFPKIYGFIPQNVLVDFSQISLGFKLIGFFGDRSKDVVFKMPALASLQHWLPKLYKALPSLNELVSSIEQVNANAVEEVKAVWKKMNLKIGQILKDAFHQSNGEINLMQTLLHELFGKIKANHSLPIIFQAEKVDRGAITSLCSDPDVNQFVGALNKVPCTA